eukprot:CAMPEP_0184647954 /NCGR_PEP_ID=MMETSP0308-20130426/5002_1 /TAXON_ID=38269 /ORGANISM="Gloeochaete witrockiana, Strain SAG 46.84" /LENGTH=33 /DNA_ID= /DNA_START= /DNA_END= /DNA_ORIENTATION=
MNDPSIDRSLGWNHVTTQAHLANELIHDNVTGK